MGTQGEIYVVLGKIFPVIRADTDPSPQDDPAKLLYGLNGKTISITQDRSKEEYDFLNGFHDTPYHADITSPILGVNVLKVDAELGDRNLDSTPEALVGYGIANESYAGHAKALPPMEQIIALRPRLAEDMRAQFGLEVPLNELELHLLYEWSQ